MEENNKLITVVNITEISDGITTTRFNEDPKSGNITITEFVNEAEKVAIENEDITHLRDIQDQGEDPVTDTVEKVKEFNTDECGNPLFTTETKGILKECDLDLMEAIDGGLEQFNENKFKEGITKTATGTFGLSDDDATVLLDCILAYKKDNTINIYDKLPQAVKNTIISICMENNLPTSSRNQVAKEIINQFITEMAEDQTFIDFEKSLNEAMKIPSLIDLYNEHLSETMDTRIPVMADAIEKEDPEKAAMLRKIGERFTQAMDYSELINSYDESSRIRKAVRRDYAKWNHYADELNFRNEGNNFKMPDATLIRNTLIKLLVEEPFEENDKDEFTSAMIDKFCVLLFKSTENLKYDDVQDAAYIYYLLKNITMLSYTNQSAKSTFSLELINNIKMVIYFILAKESEFYESNPVNTDHREKRSKRKSNKK